MIYWVTTYSTATISMSYNVCSYCYYYYYFFLLVLLKTAA